MKKVTLKKELRFCYIAHIAPQETFYINNLKIVTEGITVESPPSLIRLYRALQGLFRNVKKTNREVAMFLPKEEVAKIKMLASKDVKDISKDWNRWKFEGEIS